MPVTETVRQTHSRSPWTVVEATYDGEDLLIVTDARGHGISTFHGTSDLDWADARLQAAAPTMLAALREASAKLPYMDFYERRRALEIVDAAIAAATGTPS